ncbi:glycoside hydrolase family 13 protein [Cercospora zeae-maydis SCOH1-5]|uniref:Glycoside hydrolase family 13 protein n=1 Tax=Cercospora zeae-maydis SCOH1-5 TaxID=717836 RepID=A0A6A6F883_9PEZI|nr:glycoside hydrolase family 13 protein [Cercospora zeae-maydis SCOH1-5]
MHAQDKNWWKSAVVYQIYPASFQDTNDDGVGDLRGITQRLDYIKNLGATVIWLSPMYDSPQHDMGYDIRDYQLIEEVHARGMRLILDLVINHTSDEHRWFTESRSSKDNPKRDWYIWKPARYKDGKRMPPTNWQSFFGGSAWEWDETTQEYYLHLFVKQQPDFNFENEAARKALYAESITYWLDKGVDGFRIDTCALYSKDQSFPDAAIEDPNAELQYPRDMVVNGPRIHEFLQEIGEIVSRYDAMTVGEYGAAPIETILNYVSKSRKELNMVFLFDILDVGMGKPYRFDVAPRSWDLPSIAAAIAKTQSLIDGTDAWTTVFLENHDVARSVSRYGDDEESPETWATSAKMLSIIQSTLSGTQFLYQGQEIGMVNIPKDWPISEYIDVESQAHWDLWKKRDGSEAEKISQALVGLQHLSRDNARTPMQWEGKQNAGFTPDAVKPWMRVNDSAKTINVARQIGAEDSVLSFWKKMLAVRSQYSDLFVYGTFELVDQKNEHVLAYTKVTGSQKAYIVGNWTGQSQRIPEISGQKRLLIGNLKGPESGTLQPWEGRVYLVD